MLLLNPGFPLLSLASSTTHSAYGLRRNFSRFALVPEYWALKIVPTDQVSSLRSRGWHQLRLGSPEAHHPLWHGWLHLVLRIDMYRNSWQSCQVRSSMLESAWLYPCWLARSSNIAEDGYPGLKSLVQCTNPTLWTFLDALKLEQGLIDQN